jgi:cephalosporin-C deacetylase-like acetyl esterase
MDETLSHSGAEMGIQMKVTPSIISYIGYKGGKIKDNSALFWVSSKG